MAYLHCHSCYFSQDDFWHKGYNPVTCFQEYLEDLLEYNLDDIIKMDSSWLKENGYPLELGGITRRELILFNLRQTEQRIKGMVYRTMDEFREKNPEGRCPRCNALSLDID